MNAIWVVATSVALYVQKLVGVSVPASVLERAWIRRVLALMPVALLSALTVVQAVGSPDGPVADARLIALLVAAVALALRAPFLLVVVLAAATAALVRLVT